LRRIRGFKISSLPLHGTRKARFKKKIDIPYEATNLTSPNEISPSGGIQPSIIERPGAEMPDSSSE
jgi:hypothetical protein